MDTFKLNYSGDTINTFLREIDEIRGTPGVIEPVSLSKGINKMITINTGPLKTKINRLSNPTLIATENASRRLISFNSYSNYEFYFSSLTIRDKGWYMLVITDQNSTATTTPSYIILPLININYNQDYAVSGVIQNIVGGKEALVNTAITFELDDGIHYDPSPYGKRAGLYVSAGPIYTIKSDTVATLYKLAD